MLPYKYRRQAGAISLLTCMILPGVLLCFVAALSWSQANLDRLDFARSCEQSLSYSLASYNRKLWRDYNLRGLDPNAADWQDGTNLSWQNREVASFELSGVKRLAEPEELKAQILRQMTWRAEVFTLKELISRYSSLTSACKAITSSRPSELLSDYDTADPKLLVDYPAEKKTLADSEEKAAEALTTEERSAALKQVTDLISECEDYLLPEHGYIPADSEVSFNPTTFNALTSFLDGLLDGGQYPFRDRLYIQEYVMHYFTSAVDSEWRQDQQVALKTPAGRGHKTLIEEGRQAELERLIFNQTDPDRAKSRTKSVCWALAFTEAVVQNTLSKSKQALYAAEAGAISISITTLSLGALNIPPESLKYLLLLADSLRMAKKVVDDLLAGRAWKVQYKEFSCIIYYRDILRVLLLSLSEESLLERLGKLISENFSAAFYSSIRLEASYADKQVRMEEGYALSP